MRKSILAAAALLLANGVPAAAPGPGIDQMIPAMCPAMVQQLSGSPQMFAALKSKGLNATAVCGCANERFLKDGQITRLAALTPEELDSRAAQSELFMSYVALRAIQNIMGCMSDDMDQQLAEVTLPLAATPPAPPQP